jgi:cytochrome d ubiquinol oxidase subunit I
MDALTLARWQFGITTVYHFFFVPLTLGLAVLVAIMETLYVRSDNKMYKQMAQFWGRLFLINFAIGVATGIVQEFQFGMNWSDYSRFVGDIFGAPLAIEALLAFFMESTFLGMWMLGWDKLGKKLHLATIWLVVLGSSISSLWILIANSFMQDPVGYTLHNGRAEMNDFGALLTNPHLLYQFPHVIMSGLATGAFFVLGVSAYQLLRKNQTDAAVKLFQKSAKIAITAAIIGTFGVMAAGHLQGQYMFENQPMKMAATEAVWDTETPAGLSIFTIGDEKNRNDVVSIKIPNLLSVLAYDSFNSPVKGINQLQAEYQQKYGPGDYVPPVWVEYWNFRAMVGAGVLMLVLSLYGVFLLWRKRLYQRRWFLWLLVAGISLPYIANATGWIMTEVGRQPWIVFGLLKTENAVSPTVSAAGVLLSLVVFTLLYGVLAVADAFLMFKVGKGGIEPATPVSTDINNNPVDPALAGGLL